MQPISVVQNGVGSSDWKSVQWHVTPINIGIGCTVYGNATYTVEHCYEDVNALPPGMTEPTVFTHPTLVGQTANADGSYTTPISYFRITQTDGAGSVRMTYLQAGIVQ